MEASLPSEALLLFVSPQLRSVYETQTIGSDLIWRSAALIIMMNLPPSVRVRTCASRRSSPQLLRAAAALQWHCALTEACDTRALKILIGINLLGVPDV